MISILIILFNAISIFFIIYFSIRFNVFIDNPLEKSHSIHKKHIPRSLGINFITFLIISLFFQEDYLFEISTISIIIAAIGFIDDLGFKFKAYKRLIFQFFIIYLIIFLNTEYILNIQLFSFIQNQYLLILITSLFLTALINSFNFIDGLNGLCLQVSAMILISALIINFDITVFYLLLTVLTMNFFNFPFPKAFLGDFGAYFIASFMGLFFIYNYNINPLYISKSEWFIANLLAYPIFDTTINITKRIISRRSPFEADNIHLHSLIFNYFKNNSLASTFLVLVYTVLILPIIFLDFSPNNLIIYFIFQFIIYIVLHLLFGKTLRNEN